MATSTAASEGNLSAFVCSTLRKCLGAKSAEKLVHLKSNIAAFFDGTISNETQRDTQIDEVYFFTRRLQFVRD